MKKDNYDRIPEQVLPGNYYDGEILYGSEMNKIVNVLRTGVNANKNDIEKYASITNLGEINFIELNDITQVGIYKFSIPVGLDEHGYNYLLFQTFDGDSGVYTQTIYSGNIIIMRSGIDGNWNDWETINLLDIGVNLRLMFNGEDITNQAVMVVDVNDHESTNTTKNTYKNELSPYRK